MDRYSVNALTRDTNPNRDVRIQKFYEKVLNVNITIQRDPKRRLTTPFLYVRWIDLTLSSYALRFIHGNSAIDRSSPRTYYSMHIVTHHRGLLTPLEKIYNYYGSLIVISTLIILAVTFIVSYFSEGDIAFASFEVIRLLINTEIKTRMHTSRSRIFFSMIFLYFLIIHGTFSGRLAGFLTKAEYQKDPETLEDLKDPHYKLIYARPGIRFYVTDPVIKNKIIYTKFKCQDVIRNNHSVACIDTYNHLLPAINHFELHCSKKPVIGIYYAFIMRKNWPLGTRFNNFVLQLEHSGISRRNSDEIFANDSLRIEIRKARALVHYRPIIFDDLKFSFVLLGVGLSCSLISFIIEILIRWTINVKPHRKKKGKLFKVGSHQ